jgi:glycosyltransferase involved in cell wall biosynthesis
MGRPVLATQAAAEGIEIADSLESFVVSEREILADRGSELLELSVEEVARLGREARRHVEENYDWDSSIQEMTNLLEQPPALVSRSSIPLPAEAPHG